VTLPDAGPDANVDIGAAAAEDVEVPWQRLNPRMLLIHPLTEVFRALPVLVPLLLFGRAGGSGPPWGLIGAAIVALLAIMRWVTTTYRVTPQQVQVRKGLLRRETRTVPRDRVRSVDVTAHPLHRVLGLVRVVAGTGRSDRHDKEGITLDGLTKSQAAALRELLLHRPDLMPEDVRRPDHGETLIAQLQPDWIRFAPFTLSGFVSVLAAAGVAWNIINETHVDPTTVGPLPAVIRQLRNAPLTVAIVESAAVLLAVATVASVVGYVLAYWGFTLTRRAEGTLHVTRGLFTTRATTIEERRLRGAEVSEPLLLRAVGGARTMAIATGLRVGRGADRGGTILLPPAPSESARSTASAVLRRPEPVSNSLITHGSRATRRRFTRALAVALLVVGLTAGGWGSGVLHSPAWWAVLVVVPIALALAADRARNLGHAFAGGSVVSRHGSLDRRRVMLDADGIIGWGWRSSFFQRRAGLVTLTATTAAGRQGYHVLDVPEGESVSLASAAIPGLVGPFLASSGTLSA
jgi:putative membrane protein